MKIGYVLTDFPALSETFIRREILALCERGHSVNVYPHHRHRNPLVPEPTHARLVVRPIPFLNERDPGALIAAIRADLIEHLHSSLDVRAHRAMVAAARVLQIPFSITAYSGHDVFTRREATLYLTLSSDPLCEAVVVEDPFMRQWVVDQLGVAPDRVALIANSLDLDLYHAPETRPRHGRLVILAIARFVEKKGLINLVQAFQQLKTSLSEIELWLVGDGPEEARLRRAAGGNSAIRFLGPMSETQTQQAYRDADIFCLPCVQTASGDADGIPTTILEAMAFELPVVTSNLLSAPHYVRHEREGLLTAPGDIAGLTAALTRLLADSQLRAALGRAGRARVSELCDLRRNVERLEEILSQGRRRRWHTCLESLIQRRQTYTPEIQQRYAALYDRALGFFQPRPGVLLDIGCGQGAIRAHLPETVTYLGCDPLPTATPEFPFAIAHGEHLPYREASVEMVLLYAMLTYVLDLETTLAEVRRVLKPGGELYVHECVDDPNPMHLNHFTANDLTQRLSQHFQVQATQSLNSHYLLVKAIKSGDYSQVLKPPSSAALPRAGDGAVSSAITSVKPGRPQVAAAIDRPLVSVAIPVYNRQKYLRACLDSVLNQTYRPIEVCVCDDGSTDDSRRILADYGEAIHATYHDQNRGIAAAKNTALRLTSPSAGYVAILDSDDMFHPAFIERCVQFLEAHSEVGLVYTDDILITAEGAELRRQPALEPWSLELWLRTRNVRGDTWLARRDLVMQTELHDETFKFDVDYDLFYQLLEVTIFRHLAEPLVYIRRHAEQSTRDQYELAKYHAANLVKYGYSPEYAYLRARQHPEWIQAIEAGIELGQRCRAQRVARAVQ